MRPRQETPLDLTVVGDVVLSGWSRRPVVEPAGPGDPAFGLLRGGDLTIGNLEVPLTGSGQRAEKLVAMRAPTPGAAELAALGFDLVSLAMNHAMDYGAEGMRDTVRALDAAGVRHAGFGETLIEATRPRVVAAGDRSLAFFSFCSALPLGANATADRAGIAAIRVRQSFEFDSGFLDETPGTPPFVHSSAHEPDVRAAETAIREAKWHNDFVAVALHWGVPFCYLPTAQGPLAQYQRPLARRLVDAGPDLVVGHHPHCLHPVEFHGNGLILYSTGNFVFDWCDGWSSDSMVPKNPAAPYQPALLEGLWYESAVFRVAPAAPRFAWSPSSSTRTASRSCRGPRWRPRSSPGSRRRRGGWTRPSWSRTTGSCGEPRRTTTPRRKHDRAAAVAVGRVDLARARGACARRASAATGYLARRRTGCRGPVVRLRPRDARAA